MGFVDWKGSLLVSRLLSNLAVHSDYNERSSPTTETTASASSRPHPSEPQVPDTQRLNRLWVLADKIVRCSWAQGSNLIMQRYHDREWGVPVHSDRKLLEFLILEGAQAGLSWSTILAKRAAYRRLFAGFDPVAVARFNTAQTRRLLKNPDIVRNRLKIQSAVGNAKAVLAIQRDFGSLNRFLWRFVGGRPIQNDQKHSGRVPTRSRESDAMSQALRRAGFSFVGTTICYAFMQAVGMVNDHVTTCFRWKQLRRGRI